MWTDFEEGVKVSDKADNFDSLFTESRVTVPDQFVGGVLYFHLSRQPQGRSEYLLLSSSSLSPALSIVFVVRFIVVSAMTTVITFILGGGGGGCCYCVCLKHCCNLHSAYNPSRDVAPGLEGGDGEGKGGGGCWGWGMGDGVGGDFIS